MTAISMAHRKRRSPRTTLRGKAWKRSISVESSRFEAVSRAILASLDSEAIRFGELARTGPAAWHLSIPTG
jgi:hypothetical protein